jgi:hypothetical protein
MNLLQLKMVIPPEQEQLTPEESIFYLINLIKSKISSEEYVDLMNTAKELIEKIPEIENDRMSEISDSSSTDIHVSMSADNSRDLEIEETLDSRPCECLSKFRYPDEFPLSHNHRTYRQMFCSGINILECDNFKLFCEDYPLMYNLFEKQNMPFIDREIYSSYVSQDMKMIFSIFITFNDILEYKRHLIITTFVFYDFMLRNIQFLFDNKELARISYNKFLSFIVDVEFIQIAEEFDINLEIWRVALERATNSIIT